jgi:Ca2+-binding RTX toxin-like protein
MRRLALVILAATASLAAAQAAMASTLAVTGATTVQFTGVAAETNTVAVTRGATLYTVTDPGSTITPTAPCVTVNANTATCPVAGITDVAAALGDGNDQVTLDATVTQVGVLLQGGDGNDTLTGAATADTLQGGAGNDTLNGLAGDDVLTGGAGDDTLAGGDGDDSLSGGAGRDSVQGGADDDTIPDAGADVDPDTFSGGAGTDLIDYSDAAVGVTVTLDGLANDGVAGEADNVGADIEDVTGTAKADTITGSAAANELNGGSGNDTLSGGAGSDGLNGARGNDTLDGGPGIDALAAGPGNDTLRARDISADDVSCGGGVDSALLDASDVPRACEAVSRGVGVATTSTRVVSGGVTLRLVCPAIEAVRCAGTLTLRNGTTRVGGRSFSIASGTAANIRVALNVRGRRAKAVIATNIFRDAVGIGVITRKAVTLR